MRWFINGLLVLGFTCSCTDMNVNKTISEATGVSMTTIKHVLSQSRSKNTEEVIKSPSKRRRRNSKIEVDNFTEGLTQDVTDDQPSLTIQARSSVYNINEPKAIYCTGMHLTKGLKWFHPSGEEVEVKSKYNKWKNRIYVEKETQHGMPLIIVQTKIEDSGNWTCKSGDISKVISVVVGEKVIFNGTLEKVTGKEGNSVKLDCVAKGTPTPVVRWYKDGLQLSADPTKYILPKANYVRRDNYQLEIKNLSRLDTGAYVCRATQEALSYYVDKQIHLIVLHKPVLLKADTLEAYEKEAGSETYKVVDVFGVINTTKLIHCTAAGNPPPKFRWFRRKNNFDTPIREQDDDIVLPTEFPESNVSTLSLNLDKEENFMEYKCLVQNAYGQENIIFHVSRGNRPNAPDFVQFISSNATDMTFNITCSTCKMNQDETPDPQNLTITGFVFQFTELKAQDEQPNWEENWEFDVEIIDPENTMFTVGPLPNMTTFFGRVRTSNPAGYSEWLNIEPNPSTSYAFCLSASAALILVSLSLVLKF